jgi:hypothetical protein
MIDPWRLLFHGIWIVGLALSLASWSVARWHAQQEGVRLREALRERSSAVPIWSGLALTGVGAALCARAWGRTTVWAVLAVICVLQAGYGWWHGRQKSDYSPPEGEDS